MDTEDLKEQRKYVERGDLFDRLGKYEDAIIAYDNALDIVPDDADVLYDKAETLVKLGRVPEATQCFDTATQMYLGKF